MKKSILAAIVFAAVSSTAQADEMILDNLIVDGSQCIGLDCVNGETFGFDTLILKENNLRILFKDTSSTASFPTTDWRLTANDSSNGGDSHFSIDWIDGSSATPFRIMGDAPDYSLMIGATGFIGIGTETPGANLHVKSGNAPALRLERDGSNGFTPRSWDISANEDALTISTGGTALMTLANDGHLTITGTLTAGNPPEDFPMADYVFASDYQLMPLDQLQEYISANSHLPGIASANDVAANGLNMTEMQVNLLKKVEELTLYTLHQQELIRELQTQIQALQGQN